MPTIANMHLLNEEQLKKALGNEYVEPEEPPVEEIKEPKKEKKK